LEDYPARYPAIPRSVYPAQSAMSNRALHFELAVADEHTRLQVWPEGKPGSALRAVALDAAGPAVARSTHQVPASEGRAQPFVLRNLRVVEHRRHLIVHRYLGQVDQGVAVVSPGPRLVRQQPCSGFAGDGRGGGRQHRRGGGRCGRRPRRRPAPGAVAVVADQRTTSGLRAGGHATSPLAGVSLTAFWYCLTAAAAAA